jgi:5S rRNA maturation endonuclease (ribonuclease M5)
MGNGREATAALEEFAELFQRLRLDAREPGTVVLVEGARDRRALRRLGLDGPIVILHRGRTLAGTAAHLVAGQRRVIVLTDWDTEGGHFVQRLKEFLGAEPVDLDVDYRRRLARILRGELVHVEGLHGWARRIAEKRGSTLEQYLGPIDPE